MGGSKTRGTSAAAIVLAAGQGTRMKSSRAKVLFEVAGAPMVAWALRRAVDVQAHPVVVVVGHDAENVQSAVRAAASVLPGRGDPPYSVRFAPQEQRLGTGHAARVGFEALTDAEAQTVLILYGDVPLLTAASLRELLEDVDAETPVAFLSTELDDPTGYGRVVRDEAQNVVSIVEHKDASPAERAISEVNAGIYAVDRAFLERSLKKLSNDNAQGEYYLTDIVAFALAEDLRVCGRIVDPEEVQGANNRAQLAALERIAQRRIIAAHLENGVTFLDPERTSVGADVTIGTDTVIHAGVHLRGATRIGARCTIDVGAVITSSELGEEVVIHPYSVLESARVERGCAVGPFARLRPEATLAEGARVGNFVEVKKTALGPGAKANHLAYLGDATIGAGANVGAGTITCNYDGVGKSPTHVGEGVFIGSNSTLVAPLTIGDGAYVAAGSVLTEEVPKDALAFGRARQVVKAERAPAVRAAAVARKKASPHPRDAAAPESSSEKER